jgi:hypothetical protein
MLEEDMSRRSILQEFWFCEIFLKNILGIFRVGEY